MQNSSLIKFQKIIFNLKEMLEYRSQFSSLYNTDKSKLNNKEIFDNFNERFTMIDLKHIRVIVSLDGSLKLKPVKTDFKKQLNENSNMITHYIIIINDEKAKKSKSEQSDLKQFIQNELKKSVEIIYYAELLFNIMKHVLVPKHELISDSQKNIIMNDYQISSLNKLPWIRADDPVCRFIGANVNDVVKITRHNKDSGFHILYRYCISD